MSEKAEIYTICELCGEEDEVDGTVWCDFCNCWHCDMCWNENCHDLEEMNTPAGSEDKEPMSEKKATIEERYEDIIAGLYGIQETAGNRNRARSIKAMEFIDDLMSERGKMKERIRELTETVRERERYISTITS